MIAPGLVKLGWWGGTDEHEFLLAAGATGTPLTAADADALQAARNDSNSSISSAPSLDMNSSELASSLGLAAPAPATQSACTRERPVVLDVGANIGLFIGAAAASGCTTIAVEPLTMNAGRLWRTIRRNGWEIGSRVLLYKNAIAQSRRPVTFAFSVARHGEAKLSPTLERADAASAAAGLRGGNSITRLPNASSFPSGDSGTETVATMLLADLFDGGGGVGRPQHPFLRRPVAPRDIASVKIDVEGYDAVALWSLRGVIEAGLPPLIKLEFISIAVAAGGPKAPGDCSAVGLLRWLYGLGYHAYIPGVHRPVEIDETEINILPLMMADRFEELQVRGAVCSWPPSRILDHPCTPRRRGTESRDSQSSSPFTTVRLSPACWRHLGRGGAGSREAPTWRMAS